MKSEKQRRGGWEEGDVMGKRGVPGEQERGPQWGDALRVREGGERKGTFRSGQQ